MRMEGSQKSREERDRIYSCSYCRLIEECMDMDFLDPVDESKYAFHMKYVHGLEP